MAGKLPPNKMKECDLMRYIIYGKNLEVSEGLKQSISDKFSKLEKFFTPDTEVQVTLSIQRENQIVEATIPMKGTILRAERRMSGSALLFAVAPSGKPEENTLLYCKDMQTDDVHGSVRTG